MRPYAWARIVEHRKNYRKYKETCLQSLLRPNDTELKLDLQKYEDCLTILNIVIAREHARQELQNKIIEEERRSANTDILGQKATENTCSTQEETQNSSAENETEDQQSKKSSHHGIKNGSGKNIKLEKLPQPIGTVSESHAIIQST